MTDIATLGIRVDSSQANAATTALQGLARSAGPAAAGARSVEKAAAAAADANRRLAASSGLARHELINLSRQAQDVGVSLASGQSPLMVLAQQGTQIADIFASSKGTLRGFGGQLASIITPTRALALGTGLVGAAAFVAYGQWKSFAKQLDDTARIAGETTLEMSRLQGAASFKGIGADDFSAAMGKFSREVYDAKAGFGGLVETLRANGVPAVKGVSDAFEKAADLIRNAGDDQARLVLLQRMGLPPTMEWVRLMSQGAEGIRRAKGEMDGVAKANDELLKKQRELDAAWDKFWTKAGEKARNAFVTAVSGIGDFLGQLNAGIALSGGQKPPTRLFVNGPAGYEPEGKKTTDPAVLQARIAREQQQLSLLGQTTTALEARRQVELQLQAAALQGVHIDARRAETLKRLAEENAIGTPQIRAAADAWRIEADSVGLATGKATEYAAVQHALNDARRSGRVLTDENVAAIRREAAALGEAAQHAENMRWGYESLVRGPMQTFRQELQNGATWFDALKRAGLNALDAISSKLIDMAASNLWRSAFGGGGSGGGFLSSLFGGGSGSFATDGIGGFGPTLPAGINHSGYGPGDRFPVRNVPAAAFRNAPRFHAGIGPGERAAIIRDDESVLTPGQMRQLSPVGQGDVHVSIPVTIDASGSNGDQAMQAVARLKAELPALIVSNVRTARQRRQL